MLIALLLAKKLRHLLQMRKPFGKRASFSVGTLFVYEKHRKDQVPLKNIFDYSCMVVKLIAVAVVFLLVL